MVVVFVVVLVESEEEGVEVAPAPRAGRCCGDHVRRGQTKRRGEHGLCSDGRVNERLECQVFVGSQQDVVVEPVEQEAGRRAVPETGRSIVALTDVLLLEID